MAKKKDMGKNLEKIWQQTQKQLKKMAGEAMVLTKKGEKQLRSLTEKGKIQTEILILKTKRERLYYGLGKLVATSPKITSKKIQDTRREISNLNRQVINREKLLKKK